MPGEEQTPLLIRAADVAKMVRVSVKTVRRWECDGLMPAAIRIGRALNWRGTEIEAWIAAGCPPRAQDQEASGAGRAEKPC